MSTVDFNPDFRDLLVALATQQAEFAIIGGWALAVYGYARGTDDLDILVRASPKNATRVMAALTEFGAPLAEHQITEELFASEGYGYRMGIKPNLIEVLTTISGVTFDDVMTDHRTIDVDGSLVPVIGRRALEANKRASGRPKDLVDLAWLKDNTD